MSSPEPDFRWRVNGLSQSKGAPALCIGTVSPESHGAWLIGDNPLLLPGYHPGLLKPDDPRGLAFKYWQAHPARYGPPGGHRRGIPAHSGRQEYVRVITGRLAWGPDDSQKESCLLTFADGGIELGPTEAGQWYLLEERDFASGYTILRYTRRSTGPVGGGEGYELQMTGVDNFDWAEACSEPINTRLLLDWRYALIVVYVGAGELGSHDLAAGDFAFIPRDSTLYFLPQTDRLCMSILFF